MSLAHYSEEYKIRYGSGRPDMAAQVYSASLMAIEVDTDAERSYLDGLARSMGLSPQTAQNIEQLMGMAQTRQEKRQGAGGGPQLNYRSIPYHLYRHALDGRILPYGCPLIWIITQ